MSESCESVDCLKQAKYITTNESRYVYLCSDCYNKKYKR